MVPQRARTAYFRLALLSPTATIEEISEYLRSPDHRVGIDYREIWPSDARAICFADFHIPHAYKDEYIRALPQLKKLGLTHTAFELLSVDMQPMLDAYFAVGARSATTQALLLEHFNKVWGGTAEDEAEGLLRMAKKLTRMVDATIGQEVKVVAMEPPVPHPFKEGDGYFFIHSGLETFTASLQDAFDSFWDVNAVTSECTGKIHAHLTDAVGWSEERASRFIAYLERMRASNPQPELRGLSLPRQRESYADALFDPQWGEIVDVYRDNHWVRAIEGTLSDHGARVLAFAGSGHFGYELERPNLNEHLAKKGHKVIVVGFTGGDLWEDQDLEHQLRFPTEATPELFRMHLRVMAATAKCNLSNTTFALSIEPHGPRDSDWIIHIGNRHSPLAPWLLAVGEQLASR